MTLKTVMELYHGKVNDVLICEDEQAPGTYYTVLKITDHRVNARFLSVMESAGDRTGAIIQIQGEADGLTVVMDYCEQRPLTGFFKTGEQTLYRAELISLNLVAVCIGASIPYPLLELALKQNQIHLRQDDNVDIGLVLDLEELNPRAAEPECAYECARFIYGILEPFAGKKTVSVELLRNKIHRRGYSSFRDVYKDLTISAVGKKRRGLFMRIRDAFRRNEKSLFTFAFWISLILLIVVLVMILSNVVWGDVPFMRFLFNSFKKIGTESLLK